MEVSGASIWSHKAMEHWHASTRWEVSAADGRDPKAIRKNSFGCGQFIPLTVTFLACQAGVYDFIPDIAHAHTNTKKHMGQAGDDLQCNFGSKFIIAFASMYVFMRRESKR